MQKQKWQKCKNDGKNAKKYDIPTENYISCLISSNTVLYSFQKCFTNGKMPSDLLMMMFQFIHANLRHFCFFPSD